MEIFHYRGSLVCHADIFTHGLLSCELSVEDNALSKSCKKRVTGPVLV